MKPISQKLELDETDELRVLGIQSSLSTLQLAFYLNKSNAFRFKKVPNDYSVDINNNKAYFTHYRCEQELRVYYLISNFSTEQVGGVRENELFYVPQRHTLIDKKTDAWLCWEDDGSPSDDILSCIQNATPHARSFCAEPLNKRNNKRLAWLFYD